MTVTNPPKTTDNLDEAAAKHLQKHALLATKIMETLVPLFAYHEAGELEACLAFVPVVAQILHRAESGRAPIDLGRFDKAKAIFVDAVDKTLAQVRLDLAKKASEDKTKPAASAPGASSPPPARPQGLASGMPSRQAAKATAPAMPNRLPGTPPRPR